jgi:phosphonate transport system substrate-binding protein
VVRNSLSFSTGKLLLATAFWLSAAMPAPVSAQASWQDDLGNLRIGIVTSGKSTEIIPAVEPFRLAVQEKLNLPVEIFGARDLASLIRAHAEGKVEYAVFSALSYAATWLLCECIEPVALVRSSDGADTVASVIISRKGSLINTPADLPGRKIMVLSDQSLPGFAFALFELQQQGIKITRENTNFMFAKSPEEAVARFMAGESDALIGWSSFQGDAQSGYSAGTLKKIAGSDGDGLENYTQVWKSSLIPGRVHSVRKNLAGEAKRDIRELLSTLYDSDPIAYDAIEKLYGGGFETTTHAAFQRLIEFAGNPLAFEGKKENSEVPQSE